MLHAFQRALWRVCAGGLLACLMAIGMGGSAVRPELVAVAQSGAQCSLTLSISPQATRANLGDTVSFAYTASLTVVMVSSAQIDITVFVPPGISASVSPGSHSVPASALADPQTYTVSGAIVATVGADATPGGTYELSGNRAFAVCSVTGAGTISASAGGPTLSISVLQAPPTATATATATATPTNTPTPTATATASPTATNTPTPTATSTSSPTPTATATPTATTTSTPTATGTAGALAPATPTPSATATSTASATATTIVESTATEQGTPTASTTAESLSADAATPTVTPRTPTTGTRQPVATPTPRASATADAGVGELAQVAGTPASGEPDSEQSAGGQRLELTQSTTSDPTQAGSSTWPRVGLGLLGGALTVAGGYALWRARRPT